MSKYRCTVAGDTFSVSWLKVEKWPSAMGNILGGFAHAFFTPSLITWAESKVTYSLLEYSWLFFMLSTRAYDSANIIAFIICTIAFQPRFFPPRNWWKNVPTIWLLGGIFVLIYRLYLWRYAGFWKCNWRCMGFLEGKMLVILLHYSMLLKSC